MGSQLSGVELNVVEGDSEIDILAHSKDGRFVVIETKSHPLAGNTLDRALEQVKVAASTLGARWIVVAPDIAVPNAAGSGHLVRWRDEADDASLKEVLNLALSESPMLRP